MIIDCIADLHGYYPKLEGGDLLIIAGDLTARDEPKQHDDFCEWLDVQPYRMKIVIAGNHDNNINPEAIEANRNCKYLCDSGTEFEDLKIWSSPWTKTFEGMNPHYKAFTVDTEEELSSKFSLIPDDIDILVTHSPPYGILDCIQNMMSGKSINVGSKSLYSNWDSKLKLHIFGHIHEGYGEEKGNNGIFPYHYVNASLVNEYYQHVNKPIRVIL